MQLLNVVTLGGVGSDHDMLFLVCACERVVSASSWRRSYSTTLLRCRHSARLILWRLSLLHTCHCCQSVSQLLALCPVIVTHVLSHVATLCGLTVEWNFNFAIFWWSVNQSIHQSINSSFFIASFKQRPQRRLDLPVDLHKKPSLKARPELRRGGKCSKYWPLFSVGWLFSRFMAFVEFCLGPNVCITAVLN